jgi:hypothetical protein
VETPEETQVEDPATDDDLGGGDDDLGGDDEETGGEAEAPTGP